MRKTFKDYHNIRRKGQVYFPALLALIVVPILIIAVLYSNMKVVEPLSTPIGRDASSMLSASYQSNDALFYVRESAKLSSDQAIYDLAEKGGGSHCGSINGYSYWSAACFSASQKENFDMLSASYLNDFLRNYPDANIPLSNYDIVIEGDILTGSAKNPLNIYIEGPGSRHIGHYSLMPSFSIKMKADILKIFNDLKFFIIDSRTESGLIHNVNTCVAGGEQISLCVSRAATRLESVLGHDIMFNQISDDVFTFDIEVGKGIIAYSETSIGTRDIIIKFAIDFSKTEISVPEMLGEPVIIQPTVMEIRRLDPRCPTQVEDIPAYIGCSAFHFCKLSTEAIGRIRDADRQSSDLFGYMLEVRSAYMLHDQYHGFAGNPALRGEDGCNIPAVQGKSVKVIFKDVDMSDDPLTDYDNPERQKLKTAMEAAGWVNVDGDYTHYECCGTDLYKEKRYVDLNPDDIKESIERGDVIDIESMPFEYIPVPEPGIDEKARVRGVPEQDIVVYLHDVWEIAQEENVNYHFILSIIEVESAFQARYLNRPYDKNAHGAMQMFKPATRDVFPRLQPKYSKLRSYTADTTQEYIFTSRAREDVRIQINAGTLYLKQVRTWLINGDKPYDVRTVAQAYHDGAGNINKDGTTRICQTNPDPKSCRDSNNYVPKVTAAYTRFIADDFMTA